MIRCCWLFRGSAKLLSPSSCRWSSCLRQYPLQHLSSQSNEHVSRAESFGNLMQFVRTALAQKKIAFENLEAKLPEVEKFGLGSPQYVQVKKQLARGQRAYDICKEIESNEAEVQSLTEMLKDPSTAADKDFVKLAKEEIQRITAKVKELENEALEFLVPDSEDDVRNAILECRPGVGGEEAALFASELFKMYESYANIQGWRFEVVSTHSSDFGGFKEAIAMISGEEVFGRLKYETGVHRVQRVPVTTATKKMQSSTATVAVLPEAEAVDVNINPAELRIDVYRASGAGGQHVNKTESAVRITHLPTGTVVAIQDERSQHSNKAKAMKILQTRLFQMERDKVDQERAQLRRDQVGSAERFERIRTYNFAQNRVTDHRVNESVYDVVAMMEGECLDKFVELLDREAMIRSLKQVAAESQQK